MAVIAIELVTGGEGLRSAVVNVEGACDLRHRKRGASVVGAMAVGASRVIVVGIVAVSIHPSLAHRVNAVRSAIGRDRNIRVANLALSDLRHVSLKLLGIHAIVRLQRRILRMRRSVAS